MVKRNIIWGERGGCLKCIFERGGIRLKRVDVTILYFPEIGLKLFKHVGREVEAQRAKIWT